jgi:hypothetical protein
MISFQVCCCVCALLHVVGSPVFVSCCIRAALFVLASSVQRGGILNVVTQFVLFLQLVIVLQLALCEDVCLLHQAKVCDIQMIGFKKLY